MSLFYLRISLLLLSIIATCTNTFRPDSVNEMLKRNMAAGACTAIGIEDDDPNFDTCLEQTLYFMFAHLGFKKGMEHCRNHFKCHRWNCSTHSYGNEYKLFGTGMARASKEAAVMLAMASAGMVRTITDGIQRGREKPQSQRSLNSCYQGGRTGRSNDYIIDCDADVNKGSQLAKKIIKSWNQHMKTSSKEKEMNIHNAAVGHEAIREHMQQVCRCIGLSGACNAKCCYKTLSPLSVSTSWLKERFKVAKKVRASRLRKRDGNGRLVTVDTKSLNPGKHDLIYLLDSPNYCLNDLKTGSLGTVGRQCNACNTTTGLSSCEHMCCGRGYNTYEEETVEKCDCIFVYCCKVNCKECRKKRVIHRCK